MAESDAICRFATRPPAAGPSAQGEEVRGIGLASPSVQGCGRSPEAWFAVLVLCRPVGSLCSILQQQFYGCHESICQHRSMFRHIRIEHVM